MRAGAHPQHPDGAGDLTVTWIRWTRVSGEGRDLVDVPLNEASKAYELDVLDGTGQLVRTLSPQGRVPGRGVGVGRPGSPWRVGPLLVMRPRRAA
jgi:hypothetical protein